MDIKIYFIIALAIAGIAVGSLVLFFVSSAIWSHRWQDREPRVQG